MRGAVLVVCLVTLSGCMEREDAGVRAAKMEAQDDASCRQLSSGKGADAYQQCRRNLVYYRQQAQLEDAQQEARVQAAAEGLRAAGQSLQNIGR
jgi:hypothetical protein